MTTKPLIIHHRGCTDGVTGALVLKLALGTAVETVPAGYGDKPVSTEHVAGRDVYIVDFSYPREVLEQLHAAANSLTVLDHHQTAMQNCEGLDFATFDMDRCGARMALDYAVENEMLTAGNFGGLQALNVFVNYVQDRDLWTWKMPESRAVNAWIGSWPRNLDTWEGLLEFFLNGRPSSGVLDGGRAILRQADEWTRVASNNAWAGQWKDGSHAMVVNCPLLGSELGDVLAARPRIDFVVAWWQRADGSYQYSFRSRADGVESAEAYDVSQVASEFGGGGHKSAAGATGCQHPPDVFFVRADDPEIGRRD